mmetsp:Transcript_41386/g.69226  ORF Transcript_41386/g.69226 Transcript_41386/m.69226 type:complete len:636 (+) Transcript_41386:16-1923(+)
MATMDSPAARQSAVVVEDLITGLNEWRNIQDIVRLTFKAFHDVLKSQGEAIKTLERATEHKANKNEVANALQHKAGTHELNAKLLEINAALASKADGSEVANQLRKFTPKADIQASFKVMSSELNKLLDSKVAVHEFQNIRVEHESAAEALKVELRRKASTEDMIARLETKAGINEVNHALELKANAADVDKKLKDKASKKSVTECVSFKSKTETEVSGLRDQVAEMARELNALIIDKADKREVDELRSMVTRELSATHEEVRNTTVRMQSANDATTAQMRTLTQRCESSLDDLRRCLETYTSDQDSGGQKISAMSERLALVESQSGAASSLCSVTQGEVGMLQERVARSETRLGEDVLDRKTALDGLRDTVREMVARKAEADDLADLRMEVSRSLELKADVVQVNDALTHKANVVAVNGALERMENVTRNIVTKDAIAEKADVKDVCALIDLKSNIADVNVALAELQRGIDNRCPYDEFKCVVRDQSVINASLCADCSIGRWIWKSGRTKSGHGVPWNVQSVNTDPDNFIWEKDKVTIQTMAPGLYEVTFGFFTHRKPTIQLLINGDPVLAAVNSSSYVVHHSSGRLTGVGKHPAGNVTGLTLIDFLALPPRARVAITYSGEEIGEGFLSLKKL